MQTLFTNQILYVEQQNPDSLVIVLGDLNNSNLCHEIPKYRQLMKYPTRDKNILDHCDTTIISAFDAVPCAALGLPDHIMVHLIPVYTDELKLCKPVMRTSNQWTSKAMEIFRCAWTDMSSGLLPTVWVSTQKL